MRWPSSNYFSYILQLWKMTGHNCIQNPTNKTRPQPVQSHQQYPWKPFTYPLPIKTHIFELLLQVDWNVLCISYVQHTLHISLILSSLFDHPSTIQWVINYQVLQSCISLHHAATSYLADQILLEALISQTQLVFLDCLTLENDGTTNLSNNGNHSPNNKVSQPIRLGSSHLVSLLWKTKYHTHTKQWVRQE